MFEKIKADFERHGSSLRSPGFWLLAIYRFGRWSDTLPPPLGKLTSAIYGACITGTDFVLGSSLHRETQIGEALHCVHADGIRIAPGCIIGHRVGIMQGVTIGTTPDRPGTPVVGNDVFIGAGAKILGPIKVGDGARIAANSLVIGDVPDGATAIGVPARVMRYTGRQASAGQAVETNDGPTVAATSTDSADR